MKLCSPNMSVVIDEAVKFKLFKNYAFHGYSTHQSIGVLIQESRQSDRLFY